MEKFEELYRLAKEVFATEHVRFTRLETKGFSYLTALTFLIGLSVPFGIKIFDTLTPPNTFAAWITLNGIVLSVICLIINWFLAFSVLKVSRTPYLPVNAELITFFKQNRPIDIWYALAKRYSSGWNQLRSINDQKAQLLTYSHIALRINVSLIALLFILTFIRSWRDSPAPVSFEPTSRTNSPVGTAVTNVSTKV